MFFSSLFPRVVLLLLILLIIITHHTRILIKQQKTRKKEHNLCEKIVCSNVKECLLRLRKYVRAS